MIIQSLFNNNFLEQPEDYDILGDFSLNSKKLISIEVVETLTQRILDSIDLGSSYNSSSKPAVKITTLPDEFLLNFTVNKEAWKLPTWQHVKWMTQAISPVFTLSLDSLNSMSNAVKIYCLWLRDPLSRPVGIDSNPENLKDFITFILLDLSELFETRTSTSTSTSTSFTAQKSSTPQQQQQLAKKHIELCNLVLETILHNLIPNSPSLFDEKNSPTWNFLLKLLLGLTDSLLSTDKASYLTDDIIDDLLNILFVFFLKSEIYDDELWKRFAACFKLWCHRLKSVLTWGSVLTTLTSQVSKIIQSPSTSDESIIQFGLHLTKYQVTIPDKFTIYTWTRITNFLPKLSSLSGEIFLRVLQSLEKIISTWLLSPNVPDSNTLFEIYGELIFEGISIDKPSHEQGRAISISIICQILSKWQYREEIKETHLATSFYHLKSVLQSENFHTASSALLSIESVLVSKLVGVRCLLIPVFLSIRRFIPKPKQITKSISISSLSPVPLDKLRMCCYQLISIIYPYFSSNNDISVITLSELKSLNLKSLATISTYSTSIYETFFSNSTNQNDTLVFLKAHVLDILVGSLLQEDLVSNGRYLLNSISAFLFSEYSKFPELLPLLIKIFEECLCKPTTTMIALENQILVVNIIEQWSRIGILKIEDSTRLCLSLINLSVSMHSKSNLIIYFRFIISIYDCVFSWLSVTNCPINSVSAFISTLVKFINDPHCLRSSTTKLSVPNSPVLASKSLSNSRSAPVSPSFYGAKIRKSLCERVFTLEIGIEDQRPGSISPNFIKGIEEIFKECTDSVLQKVMNLLLQDQINLNYPVRMDSAGFKLEFNDENISKIRYFSLSSTIIIGFLDDFIIIRNSIGKFIWRQDYKESSNNNFIGSPELIKSNSSIALDEDPLNPLIPFRTPFVVTDLDKEIETNELILNDFNWTKTFTSNSSIASKVKLIEVEVESYLKNEISSELPLKSRLNKVNSFQASKASSDDYPRLFLTQLGFLSPGTCALVGSLARINDDCDALKALSLELSKLDAISCRDTYEIPIYFIPTNYFITSNNNLFSNSNVSKSFESFIKDLGSFCQDFSGPIYADSLIEAKFPVILLNASQNQDQNQDIESAISIIWSEDSENLSNIPLSCNFCNILISPHYLLGVKGQFFRIRVLMTRSLQNEYEILQQNIINNNQNLNFGPLLDGMVLNKTILGKIIRETAILANRLLQSQIQNSPSPIMKREKLLKSIIFKNHQINSLGSLMKEIV